MISVHDDLPGEGDSVTIGGEWLGSRRGSAESARGLVLGQECEVREAKMRAWRNVGGDAERIPSGRRPNMVKRTPSEPERARAPRLLEETSGRAWIFSSSGNNEEEKKERKRERWRIFHRSIYIINRTLLPRKSCHQCPDSPPRSAGAASASVLDMPFPTMNNHLPPSMIAWSSPWPPPSSSSPPWALPHDVYPPAAYHIEPAEYRIDRPSHSSSSPAGSHLLQGLCHFDHEDESDQPDVADDVPRTVALPTESVQPRSQTPPVAIKHEENLNEFIFEGPSSPAAIGEMSHTMLCRMTEVPLRATGVPRAMRRLMGVFRLDPFEYQNISARLSQSGLDYSGEKIGPLAECGREFEFQLGQDMDASDTKPGMDNDETGRSDVDKRTLRQSSEESVASSLVLSATRSREEESEENLATNEEWHTHAHETTYILASGEPRSFDTVPTPAQSLEWIGYNTGSSDGSSYSESPPSELIVQGPFEYTL
jgi:hypothetical protein